MAVFLEKQLPIAFGISRLTKSKEYKSRFRRKPTRTLIFTKSSCDVGLYVSIAMVLVKKKYHEKYKQDAKGYKTN